MHIPKMWFRKQTNSYYVKIDGQQVNLGKEKAKAHKQYLKLLDTGNPEQYTVRDILDARWKWLKKNRRPSTYKPRGPLLRSFGESLPKNFKASSLKPYQVQKWLDDNPRPLSNTTHNYRITMIVGVFNWAKKMGYLERNPIKGMPKPDRTIREEFLPVDVWPKLLEAATDQQLLDWLTVMLLSGARTEEMFKVKAEHFDGDRFILPITDSKGRKQVRIIYLPEEALAIVERLVVENPKGAVFRNRRGVAWNKNSINGRFKRLKKVLGEPKLCATVLRHSFAHHRLTSGQDVLTVAELMGHKGTEMLAKRYGKIGQNVDYMKQEANRIAIPSLQIPDSSPVVLK